MRRLIVMSLGLFVFCLSQTLAQEVRPTPGNPPRILIATSIDTEDRLELVSYKTIYIGMGGESYNDRNVTMVSLADVKIYTVGGKEISQETARQLLTGEETPVLFMSRKEPLSPFYQKLFQEQGLVFVFPREAPLWKEIQEPSRPRK